LFSSPISISIISNVTECQVWSNNQRQENENAHA
jgi:hypothetical protein